MSLYSDITDLVARLPVIESELGRVNERLTKIDRLLSALHQGQQPTSRAEIAAVGKPRIKRPKPKSV